MPNEVNCVITVTAATSEQTQRIVDACNRDQLAEEFFPQPDWQSTPREDGMLPSPVYFQRHSWRKWVGGDLITNGSRFPDGQYDQRWYSWNVTEWGTKWGAYQTDVDVASDGTITIFFLTAWSPLSDGWFQRMSSELPNTEIQCTYVEPGCDFYGVVLAKDGVVNSRTETYSDLKDAWVLASYSENDVERYFSDEEADEEFQDQVNDCWYDVEGDIISDAYDALHKQLSEEFTDEFKDALTGTALANKLQSLTPDGNILIGTWSDEAITEAMLVTGYLRQEDADLPSDELTRQYTRFHTEVHQLHLHISQVVEKMLPEKQPVSA